MLFGRGGGKVECCCVKEGEKEEASCREGVRTFDAFSGCGGRRQYRSYVMDGGRVSAYESVALRRPKDMDLRQTVRHVRWSL